MFKFRDSMELYKMAHDSDNLFAMLLDYRLDDRLSRTIMNNSILIRLGVLYPLYNDSEMEKFAIDNFFDEYYLPIKRMLDVQDKYDDLDPFKNVDWHEAYGGTRDDLNVDHNIMTRTENSKNDRDIDTTDTRTISEITDRDETDSKAETENNTETKKRTENTVMGESVENSTETTNLISAYDASDYQPQNKENVEGITNTSRDTEATENITDTKNRTDNETDTIAEDITKNTTDKDTLHTDDVTEFSDAENQQDDRQFTGNRQEKHTLDHYGKEGVQNYTEMMTEARNAATFNIYDWILDRLERAVCLGVY